MNKSAIHILTKHAFLALAALVLVNCERMVPDRDLSYTEGTVQSVDGIELYYRIAGTGPDTLIMLHGGPGADSGYLVPDLEPLAESHVLIYYDQRGAGRSTLLTDPGLLTVDAHVADLEALRKHFGLDRISMFGHSWGALLSAFYALEYPENVNKMVLASPASPRFEPYFPQLRPNIMAWMDDSARDEVELLRAARQDTTISARKSCRDFWEVYIRGYFSDPYDLDLIRSMRGSFCTASDEAIRNGSIVNRHTMASAGEFDLRDKLRDIDTPVLIITGTDDIFPVEAMEEWDAAFPDSRLVLLENAGHYPQIERPEAFFQTVTDFLKDDDLSELRLYLHQVVKDGSVPAIEAVVVNRDEVLFHEGIGYRDLHQNIPLQKGDLFDTASMAKPVTSAGVMILVDEGSVNLDEPVAAYLPAIADLEVLATFSESDTTFTTRTPERAITIRHLLTQTSGMAYPWWDDKLRKIAAKTGDTRTLYYDYLNLPLLYDPGDDWSYGVSVRVLGDVIEVVTGQSLDVFLKERIFRPLGMQDTYFVLTDNLEDRRVRVYRSEDDGWSENPPDQSHLPLIIGDGSIITTGEDYARFLQMLLNDGTIDGIQILSKESVNLMIQNQIGDFYVKELFNDFPPFAGSDKFGFGFQIASAVRDYDDRRSPGSYSWAGSYNSYFWVDPVDEIAVVLFMHYLPFFDETARTILEGFEERVYQYVR